MKETAVKTSMACYFDHIDYMANCIAIARHGFDGAMLKWQQSDSYTISLADKCRALNLALPNMHSTFDNINELWLEDGTIDKQILAEVKCCSQAGIDTLVIHLSSTVTPPHYNMIGIERLKRIVECGEKYNVNIALENLRKAEFNKYVHENIKSPKLGMCFDCGHANVYTKHFNVVEFLDVPVFTTHLHDNLGDTDSHLLPFDGTINWKKQVDQLLSLGIHDINLEVKRRTKIGTDEYLEKAMHSALKIKELFKEAK